MHRHRQSNHYQGARKRTSDNMEDETAASQAGDQRQRNVWNYSNPKSATDESIQVPPPQAFSRPKGGGGQGARVEMGALTKNKRHPYRKNQQKVKELFGESDSDSEADSDELEERNAKLYRNAPKRSFFRGTRSKGYDPRRAAMKVSLLFKLSYYQPLIYTR